MRITRRQFLGTAIVGTAVAACGGDDGGSPDAAQSGKNCAMNGTSAAIADNHSHVISVTAADVTAGVDKTYDIMGGADHTHSVTVTAANFTSLKNNPTGSVQVTTTSTFAHTHTITLTCMG
jgi:hypothetical protein